MHGVTAAGGPHTREGSLSVFVLTMNKAGLKKLGTVVLCGVVITGTVFAVNHYMEEDTAAVAATESEATIDTIQDIAAWFSARGLDIDLATTAVDEVKIPKKWDEDFKAFEEVVQQSGGGLKKYKGKAVEKWTAAVPARSDGTNTCQAVLLVYRKKPVGAYLLTKPSGEVTGLSDASATAAPLTEAEAANAELFGEGAQETAAAPEEPDAQQTALAVDEALLAGAGAEPVE